MIMGWLLFSQTVAEVVQQLVISLKIPDPPDFYALRDENDELVTDENLGKKIRKNANLRYVFRDQRRFI